MFSNVGWGEILVIFILGLILVGPERLPKVIQDFRALLLAARNAISDARESLSDEFGEDFDDLRKPLQDLGELRRLNPKTAITRTLFDGDDTYLDMLTGGPAAGGNPDANPGGTPSAPQAPQAQPTPQAPQAPYNQQVPPAQYQEPAQPAAGAWQNPVEQARQAQQAQQAQQAPQPQQPQQPQRPRGVQAWVDDDNL
ncbi:MAG: Sec-independent protein translocase protein TatB [Corynebacterium sp.]|uniref:Sec-independent protein translocase protein TatB n=1 Tax=Corynebacterium sp. TaxID=1720 RepID=UPI0026DB0ADC|nr:Sec-independent protein translocase protein TatB [Corynebacterium sp.]MDO5029453.1 Sec-independent protein translocase protein TatB [Corynebacterium sp.]